MRSLVLLSLLAAPAWAGSAAPDEETVISSADCHYAPEVTWTLKGEVTLAQVLTALSALTCERFFVPRALASTRVTVDVGDERMSPHELRERVQGALRSKGIVLDFVAAARVRRASDRASLVGASTPSTLRAPAIPADQLDKGIRCVEHKCTVTREILDGMLADSNGLAASARIVPHMRDGKPIGFKLYAIRPGGYLARLGFENGDTLLTLNGFDIATPDRALEAYAKIRTAAALTVEIERQGKPLKLELTIK